ncbi:hypothetical protein JYJ95_20285 [Corallococcus exiguus]|uniref:FtsX-like permease family protein n=1 Tax=Corallococcus exiguus TaxID=83462 RepID=UPI001A8C0320|nr:FtsX-like permease family protein [Corallococcus exiguus]MBN8468846.1 hypothetical protein [Corallococcus exiguus]
MRSEVQAVDSEQPVYDLAPFTDRLDRELERPAATTRLLAAFALLALALGAHPRQLRALVLGQGFRLTLWGVGAGVVAAVGCTQLMASLLYGVEARDPAVFAGVAGGAVCSLVACWVPALRASRVMPSICLNSDQARRGAVGLPPSRETS